MRKNNIQPSHFLQHKKHSSPTSFWKEGSKATQATLSPTTASDSRGILGEHGAGITYPAPAAAHPAET